MEGFVNHYIEEPQENYTILRGAEDIYQFQLKPTKVRLHDPTIDGGTLSFEEKGVTFGTFPTKVRVGLFKETRCAAHFNERSRFQFNRLKMWESV